VNEVNGLECHVYLPRKGFVQSSFYPESYFLVPWILVTPPRQLFHVSSVWKDRSASELLQEDINKNVQSTILTPDPPIERANDGMFAAQDTIRFGHLIDQLMLDPTFFATMCVD
jgi:hypothetical protein